MAKFNIPFNNKDYSVDETLLSPAADSLKNHLSTVMNGTGATINFGGTSYNVDSAKLLAATNDFISHLGTVAGNGYKVIVNGTEYSVGSDKVAGAVSELEVVLGNLHNGQSGGGSDNGGSDVTINLAAGLYQTGSNYTVMLKDWDTLISENIITNTGGFVYSNGDKLAGDMVFAPETTASSLSGYAGCSALTGVIIPGNIEVLNRKTMFNCKGLTSVIIKDGVKEIGQSSFSGTTGNIEHVVLPDSVIKIDTETFKSCLLSAYNEYGNGLYLGNNNNPYAALMAPKDKDNSITSLDIHPDCNLIAGYAFFQCNGLTNVVIPNGVVSIGRQAFDTCKNINSITIPNSVTYIGYRAFYYCTNLTSITFVGTVAQWNAIEKVLEWNKNVPATEVVCSDGTVAL